LPLQDPPEYFQHPQGYIAYDDTVPPALLEAARTVTRNFSLEATGPHFDLVNAQLKQLRVAFALAQVGAGCWRLGAWLGWWQAQWVGVPGSTPTVASRSLCLHQADRRQAAAAVPATHALLPLLRSLPAAAAACVHPAAACPFSADHWAGGGAAQADVWHGPLVGAS
jgi:hypothetical protein